MENRNIVENLNKHTTKTAYIKKMNTKDYTIYTPEIIKKYKNLIKIILKITNNKNKTNFIMYDKVLKWYENEESINLSMEKVYIKTKLGSYTSGGCGIGASLLAGFTASGVISYIDSYIKKLGPFFLAIYIVLVLCFAIKILSNEDSEVEMYNIFLEVLNNLQNDKNDN